MTHIYAYRVSMTSKLTLSPLNKINSLLFLRVASISLKTSMHEAIIFYTYKIN